MFCVTRALDPNCTTEANTSKNSHLALVLCVQRSHVEVAEKATELGETAPKAGAVKSALHESGRYFRPTRKKLALTTEKAEVRFDFALQYGGQ